MCFFCETDKFSLDRKGTSQAARLLGYDLQNANLLKSSTLDEQLVFLYLYSDIIAYHSDSGEMSNGEQNVWAKFFDNNDAMILSLIVHTRIDILAKKIDHHLIAILRKQKAATNNYEDLMQALKILKQLILVIKYWYKNLTDNNSLKAKIKKLLDQQAYPRVLKLSELRYGVPTGNEQDIIDVCNSIVSLCNNHYNNSSESDVVLSAPKPSNHRILDLHNHLQYTFNVLIDQCKITQAEAKNLLHDALLASNHKPQMALVLTFIRSLEYANSAIDTIPSRTTNYYYKDILKFRRRGVVADRVFTNFFIEKKVAPLIIQRDTRISAGRDAHNNEIIFSTNENLTVGHARPVACLLVDTAKKDFYKPEGSGIISKSFVSEIISNSLPLATPKTVEENNKIGIIIASASLHLPGGDRTVTISITFSDFAFSKLVHRIHTKTSEVGQLEVDERLHRLFTLATSAENGWFTVPKNQVHIVLSKSKKKSLDVILSLPKDAPPIFLNKSISYLDDKLLEFPAIKLLLNSSYLDAFYAFGSLEIEKITIESTITGYNNISVETDLGSLDVSKPFNPFGAMPQVGNSLYLDLKHIVYDNPRSLSLNIQWANLPTDEGGFKTYYDGYPAMIENDSFVAALSLMIDSEWEPKSTPKQTITLFDYEDGEEVGDYKFLQENKTMKVDLDRFNIHEDLKLSNDSRGHRKLLQGFLRLELGGHPMAFGHREYPELLRDVTLKNILKKNKKDLLPLPNRPYTPLIKSISIDYSLKSEINFAQNTILSQTAMLHPKDIVVRVSIFGYEELYPAEAPKPFTILAESDGLDRCNKIYFGLDTVDTKILTLHLQIDEKSVPDTIDCIAPQWEYLCNNKWKEFSSKDLIADGTKGLIKSGIVKLSTPDIIDIQSSIMPKKLFWIRIVNLNSRSTTLPNILGVHTNSTECTRLVPQTNNDRSNTTLNHIPAGMLKNFSAIQTKNIKIFQPYPSFGLKPHETEPQLYARAKERLRHKNRPTSVWEYERMVLENFDEVAMVKCINHTSKNLLSTLAPGHITIVVVPKVIDNNYPPLASKYLLSSITDYIRAVASPFVTIEVVNPSYEKLKVIVELKLKEGLEKGTCIKLVKEDLHQLISPWSTFGKTKKFGLESKIYPSDIFGFLSEKKYIETITKFSLIKTSGNDQETTLIKVNSYNSYIKATYPWSIVIPTQNHVVSAYEGDFSEKRINTTEACDGISSMSVDKDFVIGPWQLGNRIASNKTTKTDKDLEESIETYHLIANTN